jgi:hypothetical protein
MRMRSLRDRQPAGCKTLVGVDRLDYTHESGSAIWRFICTLTRGGTGRVEPVPAQTRRPRCWKSFVIRRADASLSGGGNPAG